MGGVMFLKKFRRLRCSLSEQESLAAVSMSQMSTCTLVKVVSVKNIKIPADETKCIAVA